MRLNIQVQLYPSKEMKKYLDKQCDYRRYCWNKGLEMWNTLYEQRKIKLPTDLKNKIKESLKDKKINFTDEEKNLRLPKTSSDKNSPLPSLAMTAAAGGMALAMARKRKRKQM